MKNEATHKYYDTWLKIADKTDSSRPVKAVVKKENLKIVKDTIRYYKGDKVNISFERMFNGDILVTTDK